MVWNSQAVECKVIQIIIIRFKIYDHKNSFQGVKKANKQIITSCKIKVVNTLMQ